MRTLVFGIIAMALLGVVFVIELVSTWRRRKAAGANWESDGGIGWEEEYP